VGLPDISYLLMFYWFEPVLYLDPVSKFQLSETTEMPGYFVEFTHNVGDALKFEILKNDLVTVLHRSVVRSAADSSHWNKRVSFKADAILFQGHGKSKTQDLQLGVVECKVYHNILLNTKSQVDFDHLLQRDMLDNTICLGSVTR
jgi:hypothetical protein